MSKDTIKIHGLDFKKYISHEAIQQRVKDIASEVIHSYENKKPLFISVLNGAFMFTSDLLKEINIECEIAFVKLSSYSGLESSGKVNTVMGLDVPVVGRTLIIIEDIIDTGATLDEFCRILDNLKPKEIKIITLLLKPEALQHAVQPDYTGFEIPNDFVVGYGLDYKGLGRNLKNIYKIEK